jgi:neutral ceramidase
VSLAISTARIDITPQPGQSMGGYGTSTGPRLATGTYSRLQARCVIIWDNGYPNVVVSADLLGIPSAVNAAVRAAVANRVPTTDLMLLASHTHNGPALVGGLDPWITYALVDTSVLAAYTDWLANALIGLVQSALDAEQTTVTLDYQVTSQSWSHNRAGLSYVESAVPVLTARDAAGQPVAVIYSYGCHPVSAGSMTAWDGDYPAAASAVVEAAIPGCTALYIPGPAGDQDPTGTRGWRLRDRLGAQLGSAVVTAASVPGRAIGGPIYTGYSMVDLPLDVTITPANLAALRAAYATRAASGQYAWYRRHGQWMVDQIDAGATLPTTVQVPVQVWRLSGSPVLRWAQVGGELVSGYAAYFRPRYGGTSGLMIGGYGNGCACYLPSNELLPPVRTGGSYEGGWDTDYPGIAGGSMTIYPQPGHFRAGSSGVESTLINALTAQLG